MLMLNKLDPVIPATAARRRVFLLVAAAAFAVTLGLLFLAESSNEFVGFLFVAPVSFVAVYLGARAGVVAAVVGFVLGAVLAEASGFELTLLGYIARAGGLMSLALIGGALSDRMRSAAAASQEAEESLEAVIETVKEAFLEMDATGRIVDINSEAEELFDWRRADVIGLDLGETIFPSTGSAAFTDNLRHFLAGQPAPAFGSWQHEVPAVKRDGSTITVEMLVAPMRRDGIWRFPVFVFDVSERVRAEEASARLAAIVESSDDSIVGSTLDGEITSWNSGAERIYGYTANEIVGRPVSLLVPPDRPDDDEAIRACVAGSGRVQDLETQRVARGGRLIDVSITVSPVRDRQGRIVGASSVERDISERVRRERYRASQYRATSLLAKSGEPATMIPSLLRILGEGSGWPCGVVWYRDGSAERLRCVDVWHHDDANDPICPFASGEIVEIEDDPPHEVSWERLRTATANLPGSDRVAEAGICTVLWVPVVVNGRLLGAVELMTWRDLEPDPEMIATTTTVASLLTELMKRQHAEAEAERLKDEFFGMVSHEMRTPLTSIIGYTELLIEFEAERLSEQGRGFLDVIERNAQREMLLVGDLLALVRIESGTFTVEPEEIELTTVARDAAVAAIPRAEKEEVSLETDLAELPVAAGDPHRLGQVVDNLLLNAIKFTPAGGRVELTLRSEGENAVIEVSDTGIGIADDEQARLFDRLFRASSATDRHIPGLGLGLTIVKAIVEAHGGRITLPSEEGEGTTFRVELPLVAIPAADREAVA
ncbi:MAG: PAS domain-containing sensor histidine kinase [Solirubrobacterales bacterium]